MYINGNFQQSDSLYETYLIKACFTVEKWSEFQHKYVDCLIACVHLQMPGTNGPIQTIGIITAKLGVFQENLDVDDALDFLSVHPCLTESRRLNNVLEYTNVLLNMINLDGSQYLTIPMSNGRRVREYLRNRRSETADTPLADNDDEDTQILDDEGYFVQR